MAIATDIAELLRAGKLAETLAKVQEQIRANPADAKPRIFLFQLLAVLGQWDRAMTQLNTLAELDASTLLMAEMCRPALNCEVLRAEIFATGQRRALLFGEPLDWVVPMVQCNELFAAGKHRAAAQLRDKAFEAAPAVAGTIDEKPFQWIADSDMRLGPILEAIVDGKYYWVPMQRIAEVRIEAPADLRDLVWVPAQFQWANGGNSVGLIPTRYAGSERSDDSAIQLARKTQWTQHPGDFSTGLGQRMFATDQGEYPLLETRRITFDAEALGTRG
jgi:type VI secretion system protein ImpE